MLFNSLEFVVFFLTVWAILRVVPRHRAWVVLLPASYVFYMAWEPAYAGLLVLSTVCDYTCGLGIHRAESAAVRRRWLLVSLGVNLGVLFLFKYFNFFNESAASFARLLGYDVTPFTLSVLLPVGISFYTFQTLSYTIDLYRGKIEPETNLARFALFVAFFPQLVAGPIERASRLLPQLRKAPGADWNAMASGLRLAVWGMFKKIVIADRLAVAVDTAFSAPGDTPGLSLLIAVYFFAFQIFCDFSGYSDIAIGVARILGYDLMENFRRPYLAESLGDFWRRWHISLSTWFRDYVYLPLGGSRVGRTSVNVMIVFLVSGLWHGANWTFVVWGGLHGLFLLTERQSVVASALARFPKALRQMVIFHWVLFAWIFFRAESVSDAFAITLRIATLVPGDLTQVLLVGNQAARTYLPLGISYADFVWSFALIGFLVLSQLVHEGRDALAERMPPRVSYALQLAWYDMLVIGILLLGVFSQTSFIYFQF